MFKILVVFSSIFVADTKIIFRYHFVAPLSFYLDNWWRHKLLSSVIRFDVIRFVFSHPLRLWSTGKKERGRRKYKSLKCGASDQAITMLNIKVCRGDWGSQTHFAREFIAQNTIFVTGIISVSFCMWIIRWTVVHQIFQN